MTALSKTPKSSEAQKSQSGEIREMHYALPPSEHCWELQRNKDLKIVLEGSSHKRGKLSTDKLEHRGFSLPQLPLKVSISWAPGTVPADARAEQCVPRSGTWWRSRAYFLVILNPGGCLRASPCTCKKCTLLIFHIVQKCCTFFDVLFVGQG